MENKQVKMSLGTFIVSIIAIILVVVVIMGMHITNQNNVLEESKTAMANKGIELDINSSTVQNLINKTKIYTDDYYIDALIPIIYKNKTLDNEAMFMYAVFDSYYNGSLSGADWVYDDNDAILLPKDEVQKYISNRFGKNVKYTDQSYKKTNLDEFDWFFGGMGPFDYKNGNYYIYNVSAGDGASSTHVDEIIDKALKYDNKIEIYVKSGYEYFNANGLTEGDFIDMDENEVKAAGVTSALYKDYDFNAMKLKNKLIEKPFGELKIEDVSNQLDTYVYTFEQDSNGDYYWSDFRKV